MRENKNGEFRSSVYTQRPPYADFDAPAKFQAIQSIIAKRLKEHPNAMCSYSGGSDSDIMMHMIETVRKIFNLPPVKYYFFETGLEMDATRRHVKDVAELYGVEIQTIRPKKNIVQATREYGQPFISKIMSAGLETVQKKNIPLSIADEYDRAEDKTAKRKELKGRYPGCEQAINFLCCCNSAGEPRPNIQLVINSSKYMLDFIKEHPIPFKVSKEEAIKALKEHYKGKFLLPGTFTKENHLQEIRGIYVPFWMFDGEAEGDASYHATRTRTYRSGDYDITETKHYEVYRAGKVAFEKIPVDASSKMPDDHMDSIEPYNYQDLKQFSTAYLPGFLADKFDVSVDDSIKRADTRCEGTLAASLRNTIKNYDTCTLTGNTVALHKGKVHYALMPVWMLSTKWNGKDFLFAMNGQTGKMVGDLPISWGKLWGVFAAVAAPLSIIGSLLVRFLL